MSCVCAWCDIVVLIFNDELAILCGDAGAFFNTVFAGAHTSVDAGCVQP